MAEIVATPWMHQQAQAVARDLARLAEGCGEQAVRQALQPLVLVYGVGEAARVAAFWAPYLNTLRSLPADALKAAVDEYVAGPDAEFFPKPGPLKALGDKHATTIRRAASRASTAARMKPERPRERIDRATVDEMLADYRGQIASRRAVQVKAEAPPCHGKTDETGITPAMRERLAKSPT